MKLIVFNRKELVDATKTFNYRRGYFANCLRVPISTEKKKINKTSKRVTQKFYPKLRKCPLLTCKIKIKLYQLLYNISSSQCVMIKKIVADFFLVFIIFSMQLYTWVFSYRITLVVESRRPTGSKLTGWYYKTSYFLLFWKIWKNCELSLASSPTLQSYSFKIRYNLIPQTAGVLRALFHEPTPSMLKRALPSPIWEFYSAKTQMGNHKPSHIGRDWRLRLFYSYSVVRVNIEDIYIGRYKYI